MLAATQRLKASAAAPESIARAATCSCSANCAVNGAVINGTAVTAGNVFGATDSISIEASGVTAFAEGEGVLLIVMEPVVTA